MSVSRKLVLLESPSNNSEDDNIDENKNENNSSFINRAINSISNTLNTKFIFSSLKTANKKMATPPILPSQSVDLQQLPQVKLIQTMRMGRVYMTYHEDSPWAIKRTVGRKAQFEQEVSALSFLSAKNASYVVSYFGHQVVDKEYFIAMEYAPCDLVTYVNENQKMPWENRFHLMQDIAKGFAVIHNYQLIHGDIKPDNILITAKGEVKICDFGYSRWEGSTEKRIGIGTERYAAPELLGIEENPPTKSSDVFSIGTVYWVLAAQKIPFQALSNYDVAIHVIEGKRESIPEKWDKNLINLIGECWKSKPKERPTCDAIVKRWDNALK